MPVEVSAHGRRFLNAQKFAAKFGNKVEAAENAAAKLATDKSREQFRSKLGHRPLAPPRKGRPTTGGEFSSFINWERNGEGGIVFDRGALMSKAPYAFIQEIGTNAEAQITNPAEGISVRTQIGRRLPLSLAWADSASGPPFRGATGNGMQQLYLLSGMEDENGQPFKKRRTGRIRKEIKGKHFIQQGGFAGYAALRTQLLKDAKQFLL